VTAYSLVCGKIDRDPHLSPARFAPPLEIKDCVQHFDAPCSILMPRATSSSSSLDAHAARQRTQRLTVQESHRPVVSCAHAGVAGSAVSHPVPPRRDANSNIHTWGCLSPLPPMLLIPPTFWVSTLYRPYLPSLECTSTHTPGPSLKWVVRLG
jgi:hypothetical protein